VIRIESALFQSRRQMPNCLPSLANTVFIFLMVLGLGVAPARAGVAVTDNELHGGGVGVPSRSDLLKAARKGQWAPIMVRARLLTPDERASNDSLGEKYIRESNKPRLEALLDLFRGAQPGGIWVAGPMLVDMGEPAIDPLRALVLDPTTPGGTRAHAALSLWKMGDDHLADILAHRYPYVGPPDVFDELFLVTRLKGLDQTERVELLLQFLLERQPGPPALARVALAHEGRAAVPYLVALLAEPGMTPLQRGDVLYCLGEIGDPSSRKIVDAILLDPHEDDFVRYRALAALQLFGDPSAIPVLRRLLAQGVFQDRSPPMPDVRALVQETIQELSAGRKHQLEPWRHISDDY